MNRKNNVKPVEPVYYDHKPVLNGTGEGYKNIRTNNIYELVRADIHNNGKTVGNYYVKKNECIYAINNLFYTYIYSLTNLIEGILKLSKEDTVILINELSDAFYNGHILYESHLYDYNKFVESSENLIISRVANITHAVLCKFCLSKRLDEYTFNNVELAIICILIDFHDALVDILYSLDKKDKEIYHSDKDVVQQ